MSPLQLDRNIQLQYALTDAQLIAVQMYVMGYKVSEITHKLNTRDFELPRGFSLPPNFSVTERTVFNWLGQPSVQQAIAACDEVRRRELVRYQTERVQVIVPQVRDRILEEVPNAVQTIINVMNGEGGKQAQHMLNAAKTLIQLSGVVETSTSSAEKERILDSKGITEVTETMIRNVLYGRSVVPTPLDPEIPQVQVNENS
ncbi:MAG TPA: hypothetical protein V6C65_04635 [Allocoleopsis sp.]